MKGTKEEAAKRFRKFVNRAKGKTHIVYLALRELPNASDTDIYNFIDKKISSSSKAKEVEAA